MSDRDNFIELMNRQLTQMRERAASVEREFRAASERVKAEFDEEWVNISSEFRAAEDELRALQAADNTVQEEMQSEVLLAWKNLGKRVDDFRLRSPG